MNRSPLQLPSTPAFVQLSVIFVKIARKGFELVIPAKQAVSNCPLSLWERVGVREPRGKQAGVNGNEWERQGYWGGPHPAFGHPLPEGEGLGLGRVAPAFGHPLPEGEGL